LFEATMNEICRPGMLNVLVGARQVSVISAISGDREAKGV